MGKPISSNEKSAHWFIVFFGAVFLLVSLPALLAIPEEVSKGKLGILFVLVFPLVGLGMCYGGWRMRNKFLAFGVTPLTLCPEKGQIGGQVGGRIDLGQPWEQRSLQVFLHCIHTYTTGSGKNSHTHTDTIWQKEGVPIDKPSGLGSTLEFCFDVPAGSPVEGKYRGRGRIHWEIMLEGKVRGLEFSRHWKIPVEEGEGQSGITIPEEHSKAAEQQLAQNADVSAAQQIQTEITPNGLDIVSEQGRNKSTSYFFVVFGVVFTLVGLFLFYQAFLGEYILWLMAPVFLGVGLSILGLGIFLVGRKLECKIIDEVVYVRRSLFGKVLYTRKGRLNSVEQLKLKSTMSSQNGSKKIEYMALFASVIVEDGQRTDLKLVEGIVGRSAGEAMERKLIDFLTQVGGK